MVAPVVASLPSTFRCRIEVGQVCEEQLHAPGLTGQGIRPPAGHRTWRNDGSTRFLVERFRRSARNPGTDL